MTPLLHLRVLERDHLRLEGRGTEETEPCLAAEEALEMARTKRPGACAGWEHRQPERPLFYSKSEEIFHAVTHGAGALLAALGAAYLVTQALGEGDPGGIIYTSGTLIYRLERVPHAHVVWHVFVLAGSVCHFIAIARL